METTIGSKTFESKKDALQGAHDWINAQPIGEPLAGEDLDFALSLGERAGKLGSAAKVRDLPWAGTRELQILTDSPLTWTAVSLKKAVMQPAPKTRWQQVSKACRTAIRPQIDSFKAACFTDGLPTCEYCGETIASPDDADIDHVTAFSDLLYAWLYTSKCDPDDDEMVPLASDPYCGPVLADPLQLEDWLEYHQSEAALRPLHRACHREHSKQQQAERLASEPVT